METKDLPVVSNISNVLDTIKGGKGKIIGENRQINETYHPVDQSGRPLFMQKRQNPNGYTRNGNATFTENKGGIIDITHSPDATEK